MSTQWWMDLAGKLGRKDGKIALDLPESRPCKANLRKISLFLAIFDRCSDVCIVFGD